MKKTGQNNRLRRSVLFMTSLLFVVMGLVFPSHAESITGSGVDIVVNVKTEYSRQHRYSCDVIYYSMVFRFNLRAMECNEEEGGAYHISYGEWRMDENEQNSVNVTVINHADNPLRVRAQVKKHDFTQCGVDVLQNGLDDVSLPACVIDGDRTQISEAVMTLTLMGVPTLERYTGEKILYVTILIAPASGYATNGSFIDSAYS